MKNNVGIIVKNDDQRLTSFISSIASAIKMNPATTGNCVVILNSPVSTAEINKLLLTEMCDTEDREQLVEKYEKLSVAELYSETCTALKKYNAVLSVYRGPVDGSRVKWNKHISSPLISEGFMWCTRSLYGNVTVAIADKHTVPEAKDNNEFNEHIEFEIAKSFKDSEALLITSSSF